MTSLICRRARESLLLLTVLSISVSLADTANISCYQCTKNVDEDCLPSDLKQCPSFADRCVTHITKSSDQGFKLKRECGLGPCTFGDSMVNRGLGMDSCDRNTDEFFCIFCCEENGCNQSSSSLFKPSFLIFAAALMLVLLLNIFERFQPPYVVRNDEDI